MRKKYYGKGSRTTSWQPVAKWYNRTTEYGKGHYYHQHIVIPGVLRLLGFNSKFINHNSTFNLLDLACGNGVLAKSLPKEVNYTGMDLSESLIKCAKNGDKNYNHRYFVADISKPVNIPNLPPSEIAPSASHGTPLDAKHSYPIGAILSETFTHAVIILALQNIKNVKGVFENLSYCLVPNASLIIVLNHPMFRIPRQSSWGVDESRKIQYRRVDKYMSPMEIPILTNPSNPNSPSTFSYHYPLSYYSRILNDSGFSIDLIEEWTSDKESQVGKTGKMENRARSEFPLFMAIVAKKS